MNLKPEIKTGKYWVHILIIAIGVQLILGLFGHMMGSIFSVHLFHIALAIAIMDIFAHTILRFD